MILSLDRRRLLLLLCQLPLLFSLECAGFSLLLSLCLLLFLAHSPLFSLNLILLSPKLSKSFLFFTLELEISLAFGLESSLLLESLGFSLLFLFSLPDLLQIFDGAALLVSELLEL